MMRHAATRKTDVAALIMDAAASNHPRGECCNIQNRMPRHSQVHKTVCPLDHAQTLKNHQLILTIDFNMIPNGEVPYTSLVLGKNNKLELPTQKCED